MRWALAEVTAAFLDTLLRALPPAGLLAACEGVGRLAWFLLPGRRAVALENLRLAFGGTLATGRRRDLARAGFVHLARLVGECVLAPRLLATARQRGRRVRLHGAWRELEARMRAGGGVLVTGHLGNWEVGGHVAQAHGMRLRPMVRTPPSALAAALMRRWRAGGRSAFAKVGGLGEALAHLGAGGWLGLLADQNAGRHGIFVPFMGVAASTYPTPFVLARRAGVPLYLAVCLRDPGPGLGFEAWVEELDPGHDPEAGARTLNAALERHLRRAPGQYHWAHRRYKLRPPGARPGPDQPFYARYATPPAASRAARSAGPPAV